MKRSARPFLAAVAFALCVMSGTLHPAIKAEPTKPEPIPELRPPQGSLEEPLLAERSRWPWFIAAGCLVASAILLWPSKPRVIVTEPAAAIARRELRQLRPLNPVALGQILRQYIVATHAVPGPGQTFEQLAAVLDRDPRWTLALCERFRRLADPLEIAKFAPGASAADLEQLREDALALVEDSDALHRPPVPASQ